MLLRKIAKYSIWQLLAQSLSALTIVILAAFMPSTVVAVYGLALTVSSLLAAVATLRLEQAILVAESERHAGALAWGAVAIATLVVVVAIIAEAIGILPAHGRGAYAAGALSAFAMASVSVGQQLYIRRNRSGVAGRIATIRSLLVAVLVLLFALAGDRDTSDGTLVGLSVASVTVVIVAIRDLARMVPFPIDWKPIYENAKIYADVWTNYLAQSVMSSASLNLPYLTLFAVMDAKIVSAYLLADRVIRMPISLLSNSVRSHFTQHYSSRIQSPASSDLLRLLKVSSSAFALGGLVLLSLVGLIVNQAAETIDHEQWAKVGSLVVIMSLWGGATMANAPAAAALIACRKTRTIMHLQAFEVIIKTLSAVAVLMLLIEGMMLSVFVMLVSGVMYSFLLYMAASREIGARVNA